MFLEDEENQKVVLDPNQSSGSCSWDTVFHHSKVNKDIDKALS
jgi:hypothetical protein